MKVVQVVRRFGECGGMESYVWNLARELSRIGITVQIVCEEILQDSEFASDVLQVPWSQA